MASANGDQALQKSAELIWCEASRKITDMKKRQWDVTTNTLVILGVLIAVFHRDPPIVDFRAFVEVVISLIILGYYASNFWQAHNNVQKFKKIYAGVASDYIIHPSFYEYYGIKRTAPGKILARLDLTPGEILEDEGRFEAALAIVVVLFFGVLQYQIFCGYIKLTG
jgi:hypothetical protein